LELTFHLVERNLWLVVGFQNLHSYYHQFDHFSDDYYLTAVTRLGQNPTDAIFLSSRPWDWSMMFL
jgi:hypothetical protein